MRGPTGIIKTGLTRLYDLPGASYSDPSLTPCLRHPSWAQGENKYVREARRYMMQNYELRQRCCGTYPSEW